MADLSREGLTARVEAAWKRQFETLGSTGGEAWAAVNIVLAALAEAAGNIRALGELNSRVAWERISAAGDDATPEIGDFERAAQAVAAAVVAGVRERLDAAGRERDAYRDRATTLAQEHDLLATDAEGWAKAAMLATAGIVPTPLEGYLRYGGPVKAEEDVLEMRGVVDGWKADRDRMRVERDAAIGEIARLVEAANRRALELGGLFALLRRARGFVERRADEFGPDEAPDLYEFLAEIDAATGVTHDGA